MTAEVDDNQPLTATNPHRNSRSDASLASVNSGDSHGGRSPAHLTRVDCGQGRVEATVDMGNGLAPYDARNIPWQILVASCTTFLASVSSRTGC